VIGGGQEGYHRLLLLARDRWPDTAALFRRAGLSAGRRCIDLGCGGGAVTLEIARRVAPGGSVVGIDMDEVKWTWAGGRLRGGVRRVVLLSAQRGVRLLLVCLQPGSPATWRRSRGWPQTVMAAGIPDPRVALVQPLHIEGEERRSRGQPSMPPRRRSCRSGSPPKLKFRRRFRLSGASPRIRRHLSSALAFSSSGREGKPLMGPVRRERMDQRSGVAINCPGFLTRSVDQGTLGRDLRCGSAAAGGSVSQGRATARPPSPASRPPPVVTQSSSPRRTPSAPQLSRSP
jgi:Methyltransferase domain